MATQTKVSSGNKDKSATWTVKSGLAQMLKGGVIMDVVTADQAKIAEDAGAVAVMALERVPSDIRKMGGVARMSDPTKIIEIKILHLFDEFLCMAMFVSFSFIKKMRGKKVIIFRN